MNFIIRKFETQAISRLMQREKSRKLRTPAKKRVLMLDKDYLDIVLEAGVGVMQAN
ncbi:hypothetical protein [Rheinheimera sp. F8]|uniref:hypothetical protein n=1 Tax=Rheinheimera sp. F8 TaxID=1763998 RepID=UPI000AE74587|nr:hypothetical protein [Rheinheimera sp. F8]